MKMLNIKYRILLFFFCGSVISCNKKLEQVNPNAQTAASFWKTGQDALEGVNAAYAL